MAEFAEKWNACKKHFESTTKVKKPSAKVDSFFRKGTSIADALKKVDAAFDVCSVPKGKNETDLGKLEAAIRVFVASKSTYMTTLTGAVGKEPKGTDTDTYAKAINAMKLELDAIQSSMVTTVGIIRSGIAGDSVVATTAKNLMVAAKGACDRAKAFCAKVKVDGSATTFNTGVVKACRDITQQIGNIDKLTQKGYHFEKAQPTNLFTILKAWGNDGRQVAADAPKPIVLREVGALEQAVNGVLAWLA